MRLMRLAPFTGSIVAVASVSIRVAGVPAFSNPDDSAMLKHAAWAAAISSSGLVPLAFSNRVANEYAPLKAPLPAANRPLPSLSFPSQTAVAVLFRIDPPVINDGRSRARGNLAERPDRRYA